MWRFLLVFLLYLVSFSMLLAQEYPYRDENTYKLELGMEYKKVPVASTTEIKPGSSLITTDTGFDFYLTIKIHVLEVYATDFKIKVIDNKNDLRLAKKLKTPELMEFEVGRAEELKERNAANKFQVQFIQKNKSIHSVIDIEFDEKGTFLVNKVVFGKI